MSSCGCIGNLESVQTVLNLNAEMDLQDSNGHTALHIAIRCSHLEVK